MKTYKIFVNGMYVGTEDFTRSEVTAIESDQDIKLIEKQKAEAINMIQPKRSDLGASAVGWSPGSDDGRPQKMKARKTIWQNLKLRMEKSTARNQ